MKSARVLSWLALAAIASAATATPSLAAVPKGTTVVLVHGAFAGSSSWNPVISRLKRDGYPVIAVANPLRSLKTDAEYVSQLVHNVQGPVLLVGHSYGGEVISMAARGAGNVKGLVFVAGLAPEAGESAVSLGDQFPTGTLGQSLAPPVPLSGGAQDLYIAQAKYWTQFAADLPEREAIELASTQRPITQSGLAEPAEASGAWKSLPSWFIWGSADKNIPSTLHAFMAKRAQAKEAIEIRGSSHVIMLSHPDEVTSLIERADSGR